MAVLAIAVVAASLTSAAGIGASVGLLGGVILGNLLFGQKGQTQEGSRLDDLTVQSSTYGSAIPLVYGTMRFAGNVMWSIPLQETRHVQHQSGGKGGGGGATQVSYTYSVSFAVGLCVGPVSTIRRIWADTKLIYDASASNTQAVEKYPGIIRFYLGDEDQLPDPTLEMYLGAGNVPAHRGIVYIVFTNLQLADFANRIPNIGAEIVAAGGLQCNAVILPTITAFGRDGGAIDAARGTMIGTTSTPVIYRYDLVNNQLSLTAPMTDAAYGSTQGIDSQGYYYHAIDVIHVGMKFVKRDPNTLAIVAETGAVDLTVNGTVRRDKLFAYMSRLVYDTNLEQVADLSIDFPSYGSNTAPMCDDPYGNYWQAAHDYIRKSDGNGNVTAWPVTVWTGGLEAPDMVFWDDFTGHIYFTVALSNRIVKWDVNSGFVAYIDGVSLSAGFGAQAYTNLPLNGKWWTAGGSVATKTDLVTMQIMETMNFAPFLPTSATHFGGVYEKFTNSMVIVTDAGEIKYPLERYGADTVPLSDVLVDLCLKAGMKNTDVIASAVENNLRGYIVSSRMATRDALQPLLGTFFIDGVEIDGVLNFIPRGQSSAVTISNDDLGAVDNLNSGDSPPIRMDETRKQSSELPLRIDLTHIDPDRTYLTNTQHAARIAAAVGTQDLETIQLSIVLTADEAAQVAERTLKNAWIERNSYTFNLPPSHLRLDPTDVITVDTADVSFLVRLNQVDFGANNIVSCTAVAEDGYAYVSTATGAGSPLTTVRIVLNGPVSIFLLDAPMLVLGDNSVGLYYAFGLRDGVNSAALYRAPDALAWLVVGSGVEGPAFGWSTTVLGDCSRPWVWDNDNTVTIVLGEGTLSSAAAIDVLNWNNVAMLGSELIQWQTASLIGENTYQLSGLLRGRRGTEDATGTHVLGEQFVVLSTTGLYRLPIGSSDIGNTSYYKGVPTGGNFDDAPTTPFTFEGRSMRCYASVRVRATRDGSHNLTLTWIRRTRWYGEWIDNVDVPLFEDTESYEIDILSGGIVVRTLTATSQTASYTAAQQVTDFGATQSVLSVVVYQLNAVIGRGEPAKATV